MADDDNWHRDKHPAGMTIPPATAESARRWLPYITVEGTFANVFIVLTGGAFLTGLALLLGADDFVIGLLAAIPFLAQLAQLLSAFLIDRYRNRKAVTLWFSILGRQVWWLLVPVLLLTGSWRLDMLIAVIAFSNIAVMIATPGWMSWMADLVPDRIRARYFGYRSAALAISTVTSVIAGGIVVDHFKAAGQEETGFIVIAVAAAVFAAVAAFLLNKIPDRFIPGEQPHFRWSLILEPLRDHQFRRLLTIFFGWNIAIGVSAAFFAPHMLTHLGMSFTLISIYSTVAAIVAVLLNRPAGILIDRFGSKPVLVFCAFGIAGIPFLWLFPRADALGILAFEAVYSGALWTGFTLAAFNIPIANSPKENRTVYLALFSVVTGLAFFASSLIGGILAKSWVGIHWQVGPQTVINYHILFAVSGVLRLAAAGLMCTFHEPQEKRLPIMIQFMGYAILKWVSAGRQIFPWGSGSSR